jgi:hypothetical protein
MTTTTCRRQQRRFASRGAGIARVELCYPGETGRRYVLPLVDASASGLSFSFEDELPGLEAGATLPDVVVRLGDCDVHGELVVMHVTPKNEALTLCGALFYATTDTDLVKWRSAVAGMSITR